MATTVLQTQTVKNAESTNLMPSVSTYLTEIETDLYALDSILRQLPTGEQISNQIHTWMEKGLYPRQDTITTDAAAAAQYATQTWYVDNSSMWRVDDVIVTPANLSNPRFLVEAVDTTTNYLTVRAIDVKTASNTTGRGTVPAITAGTVLAFIGNAKSEKNDASTERAFNESPVTNYVQHWDWVISQSLDKKNTKNWTPGLWAKSQIEQMSEMRKNFTASMHFGGAGYMTDANTAENKFLMKGVSEFLTNKLYYDTSLDNGERITQNQLIDWLTSIFRGNNGSPSRFLFADSYLHGELQKAFIGQYRSMGSIKAWGVTFEKFEYGGQFLYLKHQRIFNDLGFNNYGQVLDFKNLKKMPFRAMVKTEADFKKTQLKDKEGYLLEESFTLEVRNQACHAEIIGHDLSADGGVGGAGA